MSLQHLIGIYVILLESHLPLLLLLLIKVGKSVASTAHILKFATIHLNGHGTIYHLARELMSGIIHVHSTDDNHVLGEGEAFIEKCKL